MFFFQVFSLDFLFPSFFHLSIATLIQCFPLLMFEFQCCDFEIVVRVTCIIMSDNNLAKHPPCTSEKLERVGKAKYWSIFGAK